MEEKYYEIEHKLSGVLVDFFNEHHPRFEHVCIMLLRLTYSFIGLCISKSKGINDRKDKQLNEARIAMFQAFIDLAKKNGGFECYLDEFKEFEDKVYELCK